ncbi:MAG TPA: FKBP-type peptidyl-prolyl cis-trans isomerase [Dehalococcoidia bacterium]|nr:FKBP-type peptidyl-prolyl cis-trans isomerase [Dehalococcoidia bacterium]
MSFRISEVPSFTAPCRAAFAAAIVLLAAGCGSGASPAATVAPAKTAGTQPAAKPATSPAAKAAGLPSPSPSPVGPVQTTASGLQYQDLVVGTGPSPQPGQTAVVHYTGWLTDGTKFDSSLDRGQPFPFPIGAGKVIRGWDEGVATMKVGGKRRLTIPAQLGYGPSGAGKVIPPNATLVFDVELLDVR